MADPAADSVGDLTQTGNRTMLILASYRSSAPLRNSDVGLPARLSHPCTLVYPLLCITVLCITHCLSVVSHSVAEPNGSTSAWSLLCGAALLLVSAAHV